MRVHLLSLIACAALSAGDRDDLPFLVASLDSPTPLVAADAQRRLLLVGPDTLPLLCSAAEDEIARRADLLPRVGRLIRDLDADDYDVREGAQIDLVEIGPEALPALREAIDHGTPEQQARAQAAMDAIGGGPVVPPRFLVQITHAIAAQPDDGCIPTLVALAREPDVPVMADAIQGLWRLGTEAALAAMRLLAEDANVERRWLARAALLASGVDLALQPEPFVADWPSEPTRRVVYAALRRWESPDVVRFALTALKREGTPAPTALLGVLDEVVDAPLLTRESLSYLRSGPESHRGPLVGLLRSPSEESVAAAIAALEDPEWRVRESAVRLLARWKGQDATMLIEPLLRDPEPVRLAALRALHAVCGRDPRPFREALDDPLLANEAIEYALVRMPGAERIGSIEDQLDGPPDEDGAAIDRWLQAVLDPVLCQPMLERDYLPRPVTRDPVRRYVLTAAQRLQGPLPPRPIDVEGPASRFREFLVLDRDARAEAIRSGLRDADGDMRAEAVRWAVWEGCGGFEEDMLPLLCCRDAATEDLARLYLSRRRTDDLASRVRRLAMGSEPGAAASLWVNWEGRSATESLLDRLREPGPAPRGLLRALAQAPLEPSDASLLLTLPLGEEEARSLCSALHRTGTPEALDRLRETATRPGAPSEAAWAELAGDPGQVDFVVRCVRASRGIFADSTLHAPHAIETTGSREAIDELAARVPCAAAFEVEPLARAMTRMDPSAANARTVEWHRSIHAPMRLAALWIDLLSDRTPPGETVVALLSAGTRYRLALLNAAQASGSVPLLRSCVPLLADPDPDVRTSAWHAIAAGLGTTPVGQANAFSVPIETRDAWQEWFKDNPDLDRHEILRQGATDPGAAHGAEGLLQAFVRGPRHVSTAAWLAHGSRAEEMPTTSQGFVDEAVRWRDSLR